MADSQESHIQNVRLIHAAEGKLQLDKSDIEHLHRCEECQSTFLVFIQQHAVEFPQASSPQGECTDKIAAGVDANGQRM
jgi:hypothetical protein